MHHPGHGRPRGQARQHDSHSHIRLRATPLPRESPRADDGAAAGVRRPRRGETLSDALARALSAPSSVALRFAPVFDLRRRRVVGYDLRPRWVDPLYGAIEDDELLARVQLAGLAMRWLSALLAPACRIAQDWPGNLPLGVALPETALHDHALPQLVDEAISAAKLAPGRLRFDIAEPALGADPAALDATAASLAALRAHGANIGIARYGVGAGSLAALRACPAEVLKIDASLIRNLSDDASSAAVVRSLCGLARPLGAKLLACGLEDLQQVDRARRAGCLWGLGPVMGPPRDRGEVAAELVAQRGASARGGTAGPLVKDGAKDSSKDGTRDATKESN